MVTKLINRSMKDGKKSVARKEIYGALEIIKEKTGEDPVKVFDQAMENIKPTMEVRPRRVGGAAYQVPQQVRDQDVNLWESDGLLPQQIPNQIQNFIPMPKN